MAGEVTKAAGLTHGAFYAPLGSKEELQKAAISYGQGLTATRNRTYGATKKSRKSYVDCYLSPSHRDNPAGGCPMATLAQEVARSAPPMKEAFERGFEEILAGDGRERKEVIFETAALLGEIVLARAVHDPKISDEILESLRRKIS